MLRYDVYVRASCSAGEAKMLPWVSYDEAMAELPQARWIAATIERNDQRIAAVRVNDAEAVLRAVIAGAGRSLLPRVVADGEPRLRRLGNKRNTPALARELWLLTHSELRRLGRIQAVVKWIEQIAPR